jgi:hypothetical protein
VVFVFVRFEDPTEATSQGAEAAASPTSSMVRDAAAVLMEAVRDTDVFTMVLSRLVESIAVHDARSGG